MMKFYQLFVLLALLRLGCQTAAFSVSRQRQNRLDAAVFQPEPSTLGPPPSSSLRLPLFRTTNGPAQSTRIQRRRKRHRRLNFAILSSLVVSWFSGCCSRAVASTAATAPAVPSRRAIVTMVRSVARWILTGWILYAGIRSVQVKKRQARDATSEWGRYAAHPAARGRAVVALMLRLFLWFLWDNTYGRLVSSQQKQTLRTRSGTALADGLVRLGPLYIKLGQIISCRDELLPDEWVKALERCQDQVPAKSGPEALELAYEAAGGPANFHRIFLEMDTTPLAAASLGQVHRATLRDLPDHQVAVKVQRPYLRTIYDQDFSLLTKLASWVDRFQGKLGGVSQNWTQIFQDAEVILYREIDYRDEADNALRFSRDFGLGRGGNATQSTALARNLQSLPSAADWLRTPHVYQNYSTEKLLVMEFVPSIKITNRVKLDAAQVTAAEREYLADCLARAYLRQFCCHGFFSTDPHAGNLGVEIRHPQPPRLVFYDFGQATTLQPAQADGILDVIEAIIDMDADRCVDAFGTMGVLQPDADLQKVRAKVADNFKTGKVKANRKKLKKSGYKFKDENVVVNATTSNATTIVNGTAPPPKDSEVMSFFTLPAEYAFVARALSQMDGVGRFLDPDFDFISSAAPFIVEIKGAGQYLKEEIIKRVMSLQKRVIRFQKSLTTSRSSVD